MRDALIWVVCRHQQGSLDTAASPARASARPIGLPDVAEPAERDTVRSCEPDAFRAVLALARLEAERSKPADPLFVPIVVEDL